MTALRQSERLPGFAYRKTPHGLLRRSSLPTLYCDDVSLTSVAERYNTPLYVYSATMICERMRLFDHAFRKVRHTVCYSVKANSNLGILRLLAGTGCGFDVVSGGELQRVLKVDRRAAKRVVFSGVGKTKDEMSAAIKAGILMFNIESESELRALEECAHRLKQKVQIALRVNPDVSADTHPYISTGLQKHKFGIPISEARALYAQGAETKHLRVAGVSVHIGSQITDVAPFAASLERVAELVRELRKDGHRIDYVDCGGGLGIHHESEGSQNFAGDVAEYANAILQPLRGLKVHLLLEPGRAIVGPAGVLLTRVLYQKMNGAKKFLVVDAGMNDLLRPSLYQAYHEIVPVELNDQSRSEVVDVVGPVCETGDFLARERELPCMAEGALLAALDAGAYGMALSSNYNTRPRPAEVLVDAKSVKLIRRRETINDLLRLES